MIINLIQLKEYSNTVVTCDFKNHWTVNEQMNLGKLQSRL